MRVDFESTQLGVAGRKVLLSLSLGDRKLLAGLPGGSVHPDGMSLEKAQQVV